MVKKVTVAVLILMILLMGSGPVFAERPEAGIGKWLQEIGVFTGYAHGTLKGQKDMEIVPIGLRLGFDLKPFTKKFGWESKGMFEILYEIFAGTITQPKTNADIGLAFLFRYSFPLTSRFYPYIEVGSGLYYMTLSTREQSTQFNFISQGGGGITYFLKDNLAINIGYRRRHVSNCSIKEPNGGINTDAYLIGMSLYY